MRSALALVFPNNTTIVYLINCGVRNPGAEIPRRCFGNNWKSGAMSGDKESAISICSKEIFSINKLNPSPGDGQKAWPLHCVTCPNKLSTNSCRHRRGEQKAFQGPSPCWCQPTRKLPLRIQSLPAYLEASFALAILCHQG